MLCVYWALITVLKSADCTKIGNRPVTLMTNTPKKKSVLHEYMSDSSILQTFQTSHKNSTITLPLMQKDENGVGNPYTYVTSPIDTKLLL